MDIAEFAEKVLGVKLSEYQKVMIRKMEKLPRDTKLLTGRRGNMQFVPEKGERSMKYRTKPVEIEAVQWTGLNLEEVKNFADESLIYAIIDSAWKAGKDRPRVVMKIKTLEGDMKVSEGDYIVKGLKGEFYPCKPDVFEMKYEPIERRTYD